MHPCPDPIVPLNSLYTPEQRRRRDSSGWTTVQGVLAPIQFVVFVGSVALVIRFLVTGQDESWAAASVLLKTALLYLIMVTGCLWEKAVFDRWLFAPAFYWEDVFSLLVIALHTAYVAAWWMSWGNATERMVLALVAYAAYVINATQWVLKLRAARKGMAQRPSADSSAGAPHPTAVSSSGGSL